MKIKKVLVANRGEIAIRIFRACTEMGIRTVGIYTYEDRYSLHRYKADESYQVGEDNEPLKPYLDIDEIIKVAKANNIDAIHPGYGFLSENAKFAQACKENDIVFVGPEVEVLKSLGDKVTAKKVAIKSDVPVIESNKKALTNVNIAIDEAKRIGFPLMLKAASGGGGRGMRVLRNMDELKSAYNESRREAKNAFGDETVFLEKFVENPKHIEIQIVADNHGSVLHLFERDCSVQRRYQKVIEFAPSKDLSLNIKEKLYEYAVNICKSVNYNNIGTVEFLVDDDGSIYFIEVNPRVQVEHTVTEVVTGVDLIKTQLYIADGYKLGDEEIQLPNQEAVKTHGYAVQCRITTEDPQNDFKPDYGVITTYRSASGFGIRLDAGSIYQGVKISPFFDSMLVKVSASSRTLDDACKKMRRALAEFRVRGVKTNMAFLDNILKDETFRNGLVTVNYIKNTPALFKIKEPRNRATKLVHFLGDITVNGNPDVKNTVKNPNFLVPEVPKSNTDEYKKGTKDLLAELGPEKFAEWLTKEKKIHFTDTTMRDAHQSLLATRMRTYDMQKVAAHYAKSHPEIFSMEVWGGATFDVCMRFLKENPWERLRMFRKEMPNVLLQMLLRGSNGVGYTAYPDNLIERFVQESWENGIDIFRIFDSQNWMKSIAPCIEHVRNKTEGLAEASMCYSGDILDPNRTKYTLDYYLKLAKEIENAGAHILAIKDMAGLLKPKAASELIGALKSEVSIPIHLHTHDTSSMQSSTYMSAIDAGVDVVDVALGGLSGLTSQPNFNAMAEVLKYHPRENKLDLESLSKHSIYWEQVRTYYYPFESGLKSGSGEVYKHEIPGGQYSNLKPQAESLGLADRFHEITDMYAQVNQLFGDIIKVTPSSKVVGDMAQYLVSNNLTITDVLENGENLSFPQSVVSFFKGDLGQPVGGFPKKIQKIILKGEKPYTNRPNAHLDPVDFDKEFKDFEKEFGSKMDRKLDITDFLSYKLYPKVFNEAFEHHNLYSNVFNLPTKNFFYGMKPGEEIVVELEHGKTLLITLISIGETDEDGMVTIFFKVNGQTRNIEVRDKSVAVDKVIRVKVDKEDNKQIGAPLQGSLSEVLVKKGEKVEKNQPLFIIEAMKMETTVTANEAGKVKEIALKAGSMVFADDLVVRLS
ncbi:MAG: pyruvate carboxylase [Fluviicola sp.]|nr:MAG: pyruvate carboxylase [Fluviicola sp.]